MRDKWECKPLRHSKREQRCECKEKCCLRCLAWKPIWTWCIYIRAMSNHCYRQAIKQKAMHKGQQLNKIDFVYDVLSQITNQKVYKQNQATTVYITNVMRWKNVPIPYTVYIYCVYCLHYSHFRFEVSEIDKKGVSNAAFVAPTREMEWLA